MPKRERGIDKQKNLKMYNTIKERLWKQCIFIFLISLLNFVVNFSRFIMSFLTSLFYYFLSSEIDLQPISCAVKMLAIKIFMIKIAKIELYEIAAVVERELLTREWHQLGTLNSEIPICPHSARVQAKYKRHPFVLCWIHNTDPKESAVWHAMKLHKGVSRQVGPSSACFVSWLCGAEWSSAHHGCGRPGIMEAGSLWLNVPFNMS